MFTQIKTPFATSDCLVKESRLVLGNSLFAICCDGFDSAAATPADGGLSLPHTRVTASAHGTSRSFLLWDDMPAVYLQEPWQGKLMPLAGEHWIIRSVKLKAFTDENDTLTAVEEKHLFRKKLHGGLSGELFLLEDPESGNAAVIICEVADFTEAKLTVEEGILSLDSSGAPLAVGFCRIGECEELCRAYYRHARACGGLVTMSNTWGDCNGFSRVCRDFVLREIDAATDIGVDIVQIDDGWQRGSTADPTRRDEQNRREFSGGFWELWTERFPDGMRQVTDYAAERGIKVGMWFAPDSHDDFALLDRDLGILRTAYEKWGIRFFKLDMFWVSNDTERDRFLELLRGIYSFGDDVAVQLDVTRNLRLNYLCGREYGTVFVENRYTKTANSFPHRILRNLWMLGKYLPTSKFQFELINPDLNKESYSPSDPFAPSLYTMDYLFATVMLSNPLFWMEMQYLSDERRNELSGIMSVWKSIRTELATADVMPVGEKPNGRSISGFLARCREKSYLLVFREVTDRGAFSFDAPIAKGSVKLLATNGKAELVIGDGCAAVSLSDKRCYALFEIKSDS